MYKITQIKAFASLKNITPSSLKTSFCHRFSSKSSGDDQKGTEIEETSRNDQKIVAKVEKTTVVEEKRKPNIRDELSYKKRYLPDAYFERKCIVGPDNVPYYPDDDPYLVEEYGFYKYPQFFTRDMGMKRAVRILKNDFSILKKGRLHKIREELEPPKDLDIAIFGGGLVGLSVAYHIMNRSPFAFKVGVFEQDPSVSYC